MKRASLLYIGNKLSKKGATVTSIETLGKFLKEEGYTVYTSSGKPNKLFRLIDMLFSTLKHSSKVSVVLIDTYSTQNFYYAVAVANLCRLLRIPYVPILRGGDLGNRLKRSKATSWKLFSGAKTNIAPSRFLLKQFEEAGYSNLTFIPNTIELRKYEFKPRSTIEPKFLWVRSFAEIYNPTLAIKIISNLKKVGLNVQLCMVGPDKDGSMDKCRKLAEKDNLPVKFTGKLSKDAWIKLSEDYDIFINTTNFDNTPISVIEAMALGLPVVTTNVGGIPYLLEHGEDTLLVPPDNAEAFTVEIKRLLSNPDLVESLTKNARTKVENFDWEVVKHLWADLLKA